MNKKQVESLHMFDSEWIVTPEQYESQERKPFYQKDWFSYLMVIIATLLVLAAGSIEAQAKPHIITPRTFNPDAPLDYFCSENSVDVHAKILDIEKKGKGKKAKYIVMYVGLDEYDGEALTAKYTRWEYKEFKFKKGKKVTLWVYQNETPEDHLDDIIINVRKGWK